MIVLFYAVCIFSIASAGATHVRMTHRDAGVRNTLSWDDSSVPGGENLIRISGISQNRPARELDSLIAEIKADLNEGSKSSSANVSNERRTGAEQEDVNANASYPRNLHRVYDGTWEIASSSQGLPFFSVPIPDKDDSSKDASADDSRDKGSSSDANSSDTKSSKAYSHDKAFDKRSGFALLTAENHGSAISDDINVVFGELLIRDGAYRSVHDVSLRLMGVYEWASGRLVVVGDVMYDDANTALRRLYSSFISQHQPSEIQSFARRNITEEHFIAALTPAYRSHRKQYRAQRGPNAMRRGIVPAQCPFTAVISIVAGSFIDKMPARTLFGGLPVLRSRKSSKPWHELMPRHTLHPVHSKRRGARSLKTSSRGLRHHDRFEVSTLMRPPAGPSTGPPISGGESTSTFDDGSTSQDELVEMNGVFTSDACHTHLNLALSTLDTETLFGKAINYTLLVTFVAFMQVVVLIRQMEMTSTQAGASRVSLLTVGLQAVADSYLCLGHLTMGIAVPTLFNAFATAAFFKFIIFSIFEMRYMLLIWKARRPSGFSEGWEAMRRELSMLYSRFYGSLLFGIVLLYQMQNHLKYFMFALYSFWLPQIILSVVEDHRKPLHPLYILGMSVTRLAIPLYFWSCPHNFLHVQPQYSTALTLVGWVFFQAIVLFSQHRYGPRWFVPKPLLPEKYDYYRQIGPRPVCSATDDEGVSTCDEQNDESAVLAEEGRCLVPDVVECVICMTGVEVHSRDRMVTPCNHFFHSQCLEQWLNVKLECAVCRQPVPPP